MPQTVTHALQSDIPDIISVLHPVMAPLGYSRTMGDVPNYDTTLEEFLISPYGANMAARITEELETDPTLHYLKAVDTESGNIIAIGKWHLYQGRTGMEAWREMTRTDGGMKIPLGYSEEGYRFCMGGLLEKRRRVFGEEGRDHCLLACLVTHPNFERRGAGSMITQWGCDMGDRLGLDCYLEGTDAGYPVYWRKGFRDISGDPRECVIEYNVDGFTGRKGLEEDHMRFTCMLRKPRG